MLPFVRTALSLVLSLAGIGSSIAESPARHCAFNGAREVPSASLYITDSAAFDSYHFVLVDSIHFEDEAEQLSAQDRHDLRRLIRNSIEQEWKERLGWRRVEAAGEQVARLSIAVEKRPQPGSPLKLHARLRDSLSGEQLMAQCNSELALDADPAAIRSNGAAEKSVPTLARNDVQKQVSHWGAGLGSHIMTIY